MVWTQGGGYRLAPALLTLLRQLEAAYPGQQWLTSPQTGTIGDAAHRAEPGSDHNAWLDNTVRALDIAANVHGVPDIHDVTDGPDCEALFAMVNRMYAAKDARVYRDGYGIYLRRVTDWDNPGGFHTQIGDPHLYHLHISVSQDQAGYNSTAPWPLPAIESASSGDATKLPDPAPATAHLEGRVFHLIRNVKTGAVRAVGLNFWVALEGSTTQETLQNIARARALPTCLNPTIQDVSDDGMAWEKRFYTTGKASA